MRVIRKQSIPDLSFFIRTKVYGEERRYWTAFFINRENKHFSLCRPNRNVSEPLMDLIFTLKQTKRPFYYKGHAFYIDDSDMAMSHDAVYNNLRSRMLEIMEEERLVRQHGKEQLFLNS